MSSSARAAGLVAGVLCDAITGDPRSFHPVAGFGHLAAHTESVLYADRRSAGLRYAFALIAPVVVTAATVDRATAQRPALKFASTVVVTWAVLGGRSLRRAGTSMAELLDADDVHGARALVPTLCGRDPESLDAAAIARATVESIAENTSDSVIAPLFWGVVAGLPGLAGYRAVNTLDAMVGHRSDRYLLFGTVAARLDDVANYLPARLSALLTLACAPLVKGNARAGWQAWSSGAHLHPSPNAGRCEAAMAGVLGVQLGGRTVYGARVEDRPLLGAGRNPGAADIHRCVRMSRAVQFTALLLAAAVLTRPGRRR